MSGFRGTSVEQDSRYFNQNKKILAKLSFPSNFSEKVDIKKVNREVIDAWIASKITSILGFEDEIVISMISNLLEPKELDKLDPKQMQITITGFLEADAAHFMAELWTLLLSAQANSTGIPTEILEKKKEELRRKQEEKAQQNDQVKLRIDEVRREALQSLPQIAKSESKPIQRYSDRSYDERDSDRSRNSRSPRRNQDYGSRRNANDDRYRSRRRSRSPRRRYNRRSRSDSYSPHRRRSSSRSRSRGRSSRNRRRRSPSYSSDSSRASASSASSKDSADRSPRRED